MMKDPLMRVLCKEKGESIIREVRLARLTVERLREYYEHLKQFKVVFNDHVQGDFESFANIFLSQNEATGQLLPNGLIWEVDDVGILFITEIREAQCLAHFTFWDRRFKGREQLIREMLSYLFDRFGFERIEARAALYATPAMIAVERIGFVKEGRLRNAVKYEGKWFDVNVYSMLREEAA